MTWLLNPFGTETTTRSYLAPSRPRRKPVRRNKGTSAGVRKSWRTRKAAYGESGDSAAIRVLHGLGITGLGIKRAGPSGRAAAARTVRKHGAKLPTYWSRLISGMPKGKRAPRRRKNAFFGNTETHARKARVKWTHEHWPRITLYTFIKRHGVMGGQQAYARYLREHQITLSRRRGGKGRRSPASFGKESVMARTRRRRKNARGHRRRRTAHGRFASARRTRRRRSARRSNPAPKRRRRRSRARKARSSRRRRRNAPILWRANSPKRRRRRRSRSAAAPKRRRRRSRRRNPPILWRANAPKRRRRRRSSGGRRRRSSSRRRRRNPPILWRANAGRKRRRRRNPDLLGRLKDAIPTFDDVANGLAIAGAGLTQEMFATKLLDMLGLSVIYKTVPYAEKGIFTVGSTMLTALLFGGRWAKPVMYGGLTDLLRSLLVREVLVKGYAGDFMKQAAADAGYRTMADYVSYGDQQTLPGGGWGGVSDFVTLGNEESAAGAIACDDTFTVEPGQSEMADYYGVTAF